MRDPAQLRRDPGLPQACGDDLRPPTADEMAALVAGHLVPNGRSPEDCIWESARWKPGVSLTCTYRLQMGAPPPVRVTWKSYVDGKAEQVDAAAFRRAAHGAETALAPCAFLPDGRSLLFSFPHDRVLPGLRHFVDGRWTSRFLEDSGAVLPRTVRRRRTVDEIVRYKPERRAVARRRLTLRPPAASSHFELGVRVLVPERAERTIAARRAFEARAHQPLGPRLVAVDPAHGVLFEEWLDAVALAPTDFGQAGTTARLLVELHGTDLPRGVPRARGAALEGDRDLLHLDARNTPQMLATPLPHEDATTWTHGDLHPDHIARVGSDWRLLDWDELGAGDPALDLASWMADAVAAPEVAQPRATAEALLAAYAAAGGAASTCVRARAHVPAQLLQRAAGGVRRLEDGAFERARWLLARAEPWRPSGVSR